MPFGLMAIAILDSFDPFTTDIISISGLILGVLGSLYLSYDLLGRAGGPLRWLIRLSTPSLISAAGLAACGGALFWATYGWSPQILQGAALYGVIGLLVGFFNGSFVNPTVPREQMRLFSLRHCIIGALAAFWLGIIEAMLLSLPLEVILSQGIVTGIIGAIAAGVWSRANNTPQITVENVPLFSSRGFYSGYVSTLVLAFAVAMTLNFMLNVSLTFGILAAVRASALAAITGGLTGALTQYIFWKAEKLPASRLGGIGAIFTLIGFLAQLVQPILDALQRSLSR